MWFECVLGYSGVLGSLWGVVYFGFACWFVDLGVGFVCCDLGFEFDFVGLMVSICGLIGSCVDCLRRLLIVR